jgi:hypothetical protein
MTRNRIKEDVGRRSIVARLSEKLAQVAKSIGVDQRWVGVVGFERRIARRGAVRAALKAADYARLTRWQRGTRPLKRAQVSENFAAEDPGRGRSSNGEPFSLRSKASYLREARELARRFREAGAFGLAISRPRSSLQLQARPIRSRFPSGVEPTRHLFDDQIVR